MNPVALKYNGYYKTPKILIILRQTFQILSHDLLNNDLSKNLQFLLNFIRVNNYTIFDTQMLNALHKIF